MSNESKRIHSFQVGKTWFNVWENSNSEKGTSFTQTNIVHSYKDATGDWKPTNNFSHDELADLELGVREARRMLKIQHENEPNNFQDRLNGERENSTPKSK